MKTKNFGTDTTVITLMATIGMNGIILAASHTTTKKDLLVEISLPPILASRLNVEMKIHWWWLLQTS